MGKNRRKTAEDHGLQNAIAGYQSIVEMVAALGCDYDRLEALRETRDEFTGEHPEGSELTASDWHAPGSTDCEPTEFYILLTTGGPTLRMRGELDNGEPSRAWLEYQDWGTPWTQLFKGSDGVIVDQDVLLTYARCFYFGEG